MLPQGCRKHSKSRNNYPPDVQGYVPTGFLRVAPWDRSNLVAADVRQNYLAEVTATVGSAFLGLSVGCARCHDHKYDPIPTRDYYRMQSFFQASEASNRLTVPYRNPEFAAMAAAKIAGYEEQLRSGPEKKEFDAFEKVLFDPWEQTAYDVNDTVLLDPRTDPDVKDFLKHVKLEKGWKTWYEQRGSPSKIGRAWRRHWQPSTAREMPRIFRPDHLRGSGSPMTNCWRGNWRWRSCAITTRPSAAAR